MICSAVGGSALEYPWRSTWSCPLEKVEARRCATCTATAVFPTPGDPEITATGHLPTSAFSADSSASTTSRRPVKFPAPAGSCRGMAIDSACVTASCRSICPDRISICSCRSACPGATPSSAFRTRVAIRKASSASACRPDRNSASMSFSQRLSRSGYDVVRARSSATTSTCRFARSSRSTLLSAALSSSLSILSSSSSSADRSRRSGSSGPRHSAVAFRSNDSASWPLAVRARPTSSRKR